MHWHLDSMKSHLSLVFLAGLIFLAAWGNGPSFAAEDPATQTSAFRPRGVPAVSPNGGPVIVNSASFQTGISPGGLATIFGGNLAPFSNTVLGLTNPLPLQLFGIQVLIGGLPAPIYSMAFMNGLDQITVQVPSQAPVGLGAAEIQVFSTGTQVADFFSDSFTQAPGIFVHDFRYAVALASDSSLIGPLHPASPGDPLVLYVTGLGPVDVKLEDGIKAPSTAPLARTLIPFQVILNHKRCQVSFSGLVPGLVGVYHVDFSVPQDAASGNLQIYIQSPTVNSAIALLPIR
jgi:uncharacterized protein (TIGR03437 family)